MRRTVYGAKAVYPTCDTPRPGTALWKTAAGKSGRGYGVNFEFSCGWCGEDNVLYGERVGFWGNRFEVPTFWDCWDCGGENETHDPPWTPAD